MYIKMVNMLWTLVHIILLQLLWKLAQDIDVSCFFVFWFERFAKGFWGIYIIAKFAYYSGFFFSINSL